MTSSFSESPEKSSRASTAVARSDSPNADGRTGKRRLESQGAGPLEQAAREGLAEMFELAFESSAQGREAAGFQPRQQTQRLCAGLLGQLREQPRCVREPERGELELQLGGGVRPRRQRDRATPGQLDRALREREALERQAVRRRDQAAPQLRRRQIELEPGRVVGARDDCLHRAAGKRDDELLRAALIGGEPRRPLARPLSRASSPTVPSTGRQGRASKTTFAVADSGSLRA